MWIWTSLESVKATEEFKRCVSLHDASNECVAEALCAVFSAREDVDVLFNNPCMLSFDCSFVQKLKIVHFTAI